MRVAIIHYWLVSMRGGEKVLEALCKLFPDADIFTHVYNPDAVSDTIRRHKVTTTFINSLPFARRNYKRYLPLMPIALEQIDLRGYDLIISSESGPAKGVIPPAGAVHICYCHSPMRYIWNMFHDYRDRAGFITGLLMPPLAHYLRTWDSVASMRVDHFIANSQTVAARIEKYYRRDAAVIHPPVDADAFETVPAAEVEDYYLLAGELVGYKRPDLAIEAFNASRRRLVVIGGGEMLPEIRRSAGPTIKVLGPQPFEALRRHYARCRALIFPGEEDFGIVPVEVMASGRPVIAYGRGGATETLTEGVSGLFFYEQTAAAIEQAVCEFEQMRFDPNLIKAQAAKFHIDIFASEITAVLENALAHNSARSRLRPGKKVLPR
ncbi:glycosyltransferase [Methylocapsa polymorpha]|uniref:Glycosyltransferase n=1 Tax=Methylocapsa polymorpha TaxID=3080828 RepID=A0ABZ0HQE6_9HYPH|nr:glycosyltransferase [Methylocapsa sp. RX1]